MSALFTNIVCLLVKYITLLEVVVYGQAKIQGGSVVTFLRQERLRARILSLPMTNHPLSPHLLCYHICGFFRLLRQAFVC